MRSSVLLGSFFLGVASLIGPAVRAQDAPTSRPTSSPTSRPASDQAWTGALDETAFAKLHHLRGDAAPALRGETVEIAGTSSYLSLPADGKPPLGGVVVIHEWWGLNDHIKHWADRLAEDGFAAVAVDLYGGKVATEREDALANMKAVQEDGARRVLLAAHKFLADDPRIGAERRACIGWCFGGGWSLQLALAAPDLDAAVIYYGRLETDAQRLRQINARVLAVFGSQDSSIPNETVDLFEASMQEAGRDVRVLRYDANHAFANPSSDRYDGEHAADAWREVRAFLAPLRERG
ncbi:MAG: dienelactone hydrolase family protein [Planctomycetota bacterium]